MSHQYSNHSLFPSSNSSRRFHQQQIPDNEFSSFHYPSQRQILDYNNHHHRSNRITNSSIIPHYYPENPSSSRSSQHDTHTKRQRSSNSQSQHHHQHRPRGEQKRSRHQNHDRNEQSYPNQRSTQMQSYNDQSSHHRRSSPDRPSVSSRHRNPMTSFDRTTTHHSPLFHRRSMAMDIHQRPSPAFLLSNLLHRIMDSHASTSFDDNLSLPTASIDLIAYAWMTPNQDIVSVPAAISIRFGDFFDLMLPDETPVIGLTDSELDRIPTVTYKHRKSDEKCSICLTEYTNGEKLKRLKCKHYFHSECIDPWLKTSTRCPICRNEQTN